MFHKLTKICQVLTKELVPQLNHYATTIANKDKDTQMKFISALNSRVLSVIYALIRIYYVKRVQTETLTQVLTE